MIDEGGEREQNHYRPDGNLLPGRSTSAVSLLAGRSEALRCRRGALPGLDALDRLTTGRLTRRPQCRPQSLQKRIEDGELQFRVRTLESDRLLKRINLALKSLIYATVSGFSFLSASVLLNGGYLGGAIAAFSVSVFGLLILLRSLFKLSVRERLDRMTEK